MNEIDAEYITGLNHHDVQLAAWAKKDSTHLLQVRLYAAQSQDMKKDKAAKGGRG
jgi:hypothetical protein